MKKLKFDNNTDLINLYELSENEGKGSMRVIYNPKLKKKVLTAVYSIKSYKKFCEKIGISYTTFWDYLNRRNYIPLFVLKELENRSGIKFQNDIKYLEYGLGSTKKRTKAVLKITPILAKILGAFVADGHLKKRESFFRGRKVIHYEIVFREEYESNVDSLVRWFNTVFGINLKSKKIKNHFYLYISNKILFRYFNRIFNFKSGRKTETVSVPKLIKYSSKEIQKSFVLGIMMFDGYVDKRNGYVELQLKNKKMINEVKNILSNINIFVDYISIKNDKFGRYRIVIRKHKKLYKCLLLFEPYTEKWWRLKEHLFGFATKTKDLNVLLRNLDKYYPNLSNVVKTIDLLDSLGKEATFKNIKEKLNRQNTIVYESLSKLETIGILDSKKFGTKKTWFLNNEFPIPDRRKLNG